MKSDKLINEISLRCNDISFQDFEKSVYVRALKRADRLVAKKYEIIQRAFSFRLGDMTTDTSKDINMKLSGFKSEYMVVVNNTPLEKVSNVMFPHFKMCYYLENREGELFFNYQLGVKGLAETDSNNDIDYKQNMDFFERSAIESTEDTKTLDDEVVILYTVIPDIVSDEERQTAYVIPNIYEEEQIHHSLEYLSNLGITKFASNTEKSMKYQMILKSVQRRTDFDKRVQKNEEFIKIIPIQYP